jgi:hypothetical protein
MMLPKSDMFVTLRNDGPSMDERDKHLSMIVHGDGSKRLRMEEDATSGDFRTLKPPYVTPRLLLKAELLCICAIPWISR